MAKTTVRSGQVRNINLLIEDLKDFGVEDAGGLNVTVNAGRIRDDVTITDKADQALLLTDNTTNFVEITNLGVASANTSAFTSGSIPLAEVVTASGDISSVTDKRTWTVDAATNFKAGNFTRDMSLASGTQTITGVGFIPKAIIFISAETNIEGVASWGFTSGTPTGENLVLRDSHLTVAGAYVSQPGGAGTGGCIHVQKNVGNTDRYEAALNSFVLDGFILDWTRTGTPTGTLRVTYLAIR